LSPEQQSHLQKIQMAGHALLAVINDVLDLSKIEAGQMQLESEVFAPATLLRELSGLMQAAADQKSIELDIGADESVPAMLAGDVTRIRQILLNLLSNAIKFTDRGRVSLHLRAEPHSLQRALLHGVVRDTGIGIAADVQAKLVSPFTQADASTTRRFGGTGLGLSIVRRLVEMMGGEVGVRSEPGQGSEFWLRLPLALPASGLIGAADDTRGSDRDRSAEWLRDVRVLVVDDSAINLELATFILSREGAVVHTCGNGALALEYPREHAAEVDVVLMDVQMPVMDGNQATIQLRSE